MLDLFFWENSHLELLTALKVRERLFCAEGFLVLVFFLKRAFIIYVLCTIQP